MDWNIIRKQVEKDFKTHPHSNLIMDLLKNDMENHSKSEETFKRWKNFLDLDPKFTSIFNEKDLPKFFENGPYSYGNIDNHFVDFINMFPEEKIDDIFANYLDTHSVLEGVRAYYLHWRKSLGYEYESPDAHLEMFEKLFQEAKNNSVIEDILTKTPKSILNITELLKLSSSTVKELKIETLDYLYAKDKDGTINCGDIARLQQAINKFKIWIEKEDLNINIEDFSKEQLFDFYKDYEEGCFNNLEDEAILGLFAKKIIGKNFDEDLLFSNDKIYQQKLYVPTEEELAKIAASFQDITLTRQALVETGVRNNNDTKFSVVLNNDENDLTKKYKTVSELRHLGDAILEQMNDQEYEDAKISNNLCAVYFSPHLYNLSDKTLKNDAIVIFGEDHSLYGDNDKVIETFKSAFNLGFKNIAIELPSHHNKMIQEYTNARRTGSPEEIIDKRNALKKQLIGASAGNRSTGKTLDNHVIFMIDAWTDLGGTFYASDMSDEELEKCGFSATSPEGLNARNEYTANFVKELGPTILFSGMAHTGNLNTLGVITLDNILRDMGKTTLSVDIKLGYDDSRGDALIQNGYTSDMTYTYGLKDESNQDKKKNLLHYPEKSFLYGTSAKKAVQKEHADMFKMVENKKVEIASRNQQHSESSLKEEEINQTAQRKNNQQFINNYVLNSHHSDDKITRERQVEIEATRVMLIEQKIDENGNHVGPKFFAIKSEGSWDVYRKNSNEKEKGLVSVMNIDLNEISLEQFRNGEISLEKFMAEKQKLNNVQQHDR